MFIDASNVDPADETDIPNCVFFFEIDDTISSISSPDLKHINHEYIVAIAATDVLIGDMTLTLDYFSDDVNRRSSTIYSDIDVEYSSTDFVIDEPNAFIDSSVIDAVDHFRIGFIGVLDDNFEIFLDDDSDTGTNEHCLTCNIPSQCRNSEQNYYEFLIYEDLLVDSPTIEDDCSRYAYPINNQDDDFGIDFSVRVTQSSGALFTLKYFEHISFDNTRKSSSDQSSISFITSQRGGSISNTNYDFTPLPFYPTIVEDDDASNDYHDECFAQNSELTYEYDVYVPVGQSRSVLEFFEMCSSGELCLDNAEEYASVPQNLIDSGALHGLSSAKISSIFNMPFSAGVFGDPHVVGWYGQRYDLFGEHNAFYNLVSDRNVQINVQMKKFEMFSKNLYMGGINIKTATHNLWIFAGDKDDHGFIEYDGELIEKPSVNNIQYELGDNSYFTYHPNNDPELSHYALRHSEVDRYIVVNFDDQFDFIFFLIARPVGRNIHYFIDFESTLLAHNENVHGLFGQTAKPVDINKRSLWDFEGEIDDYKISHRSADDFVFNRFEQ